MITRVKCLVHKFRDFICSEVGLLQKNDAGFQPMHSNGDLIALFWDVETLYV